jgi:hypothetical protein
MGFAVVAKLVLVTANEKLVNNVVVRCSINNSTHSYRTTTLYPTQSPMMPATPANTGGAGTGSLNKAKTTPQSAPVTVDKSISFILFPSWRWRDRFFTTAVVAEKVPCIFIFDKNMSKEVASNFINQRFHHPSNLDIAILLGLAHKDELPF